MGTMNISNTSTGGYSGVTDVTVAAKTTDSATGQKETEWQNANWTKQWGYFNAVPDLKAALLMKAVFNVGKGYTTKDTYAQAILDHVSGWGKDSFRDILFNMDVGRKIFGDSFAEIIEMDGIIVNIKPLDPDIKIVTNSKGIIIRYEQTSKIDGKIKKWEPHEIFHLSNNRMCSQIHGISDIDALEETIKADNESFADTKRIMHYGARPLIMWKLKTDNAAKIAAFVARISAARKLGDDMFVPDDENIVSFEVVKTDPSPAIFQWRDEIRNRFYRTIGLPQIVPGAGGQSTESESKTIYFSFEQICENEQSYLEAQIWNQLHFHIDLIPPETMALDLQRDTGKEGALATAQPSDLTAGAGR